MWNEKSINFAFNPNLMMTFIIILGTIAASALFSGTEIAFISANKVQVELDKNKGKWSAAVLSYFYEHSSLFIAMLLLGNNVALVVYGMQMEQLLIPPLKNSLPQSLTNDFFILFFETIIATFIILVFAEFLPKALFRINANKALNWLIFILIPLYYLFLPLVYMFIKLSEFILKFFFRTTIVEPQYAFSSADLEHYINEFASGHEEDEDNQDSDLEMLQNAINFKTVKVRECMVPRTEITAIEIEEPVDSLADMFNSSGHSKILVYSESVDHIIGYVHAWDLFKSPRKIRQILRNIIFLPETMQANALLEKMIREKQSIAVVLDEFGGTAGVVTLEDLMEEIFGEIEDEFDKQELTDKKIDEATYIFSARLEIDFINRKYHLDIPESDEYETVGGLIINHSENIPDVNSHIRIDRFEFVILKASESKIELVKMKIRD